MPTKYSPRFGKLRPGLGSRAVGNYRLYDGNVIDVRVQLTMGSSPTVMRSPYIKLPFFEVEDIDWSAFFIARSHDWPTDKAFHIMGRIENGNAIVDIDNTWPFTWTKGDHLFMVAIYQCRGIT